MARVGHEQRKTTFASVVLSAAAVALLSGIALMSAWVACAESLPLQVYSTPLGELRRVSLGVGMIVRLNTDTGLSAVASPLACEVALDHGEALFEVTAESARSLRVLAGLVMVSGRQSRFSVRVRDAKSVDVLVTAGQVNVNTTTVIANQLARVTSGNVVIRELTTEDVGRRLEWMTGYVSFSGETLGDATAEFNRYNRRKLVIADRTISTITIGGKFRAKDVESFVAALRPLGIRRMTGDVARGDDAVRLVGSQGGE
jgi:transmembrane sensor